MAIWQQLRFEEDWPAVGLSWHGDEPCLRRSFGGSCGTICGQKLFRSVPKEPLPTRGAVG
jgi:hypothetical protein